jgi:hypothetical protein
MTDILPFKTTPQKLRELASKELVYTETAIALLDAADHRERIEGWMRSLQCAIEREGYEILNSVDGKTVEIRRKAPEPAA